MIGACASCVFWESSGRRRTGECHRFPPVKTPVGLSGWAWPTTRDLDVCGEYEQESRS